MDFAKLILYIVSLFSIYMLIDALIEFFVYNVAQKEKCYHSGVTTLERLQDEAEDEEQEEDDTIGMLEDMDHSIPAEEGQN